jgi:hypothetical protein
VAGSDANSGDIFAGGDYGVWQRSGGEWLPRNVGVVGGSANRVTDIALSPAYAHDRTVLMSQASSVSIGAVVYKSTDGGATWRNVKNSAYVNQVELSPAFPIDGRAFVVADQRILESSDAGESWTLQPFWGYTQTVRLLAVSPNFATNHALYAVGNNAYRSTDGGVTWLPASAPPPIVSDSWAGDAKQRAGVDAEQADRGRRRPPLPGHLSLRDRRALCPPRPDLAEQRRRRDLDDCGPGAGSAHRRACPRPWPGGRASLRQHLRPQRV